MPTVNVTIVPADTRAADEGLYIHFAIGAAQFAELVVGQGDAFDPLQ